MADTKTLAGIHDEIQSIVSDKLQVVSYKWLSRNFSVSSNAAKSLLLEFVDKYGSGLEVIYSISGWLKADPSTYHVRLVSKHQLSDVKQEFDGNCSIQVYSVQAGLPKDPATLWNHEFVQAEDLFTQPLTKDNCLRNNKFCGVSNSSVTRKVDGIPLSSASSEAKTTGVTELSKSGTSRQTSSVPQPQEKKVHQATSDISEKSSNIATNMKTESHVKTEKEKVAQVLPDRKKVQNDKSSSGSGSALASMWGRASVKSNPNLPSEQPNSSRPNSADAQICAREEADHGSSDEEGQEFKIKRVDASRKRRLVIDDSDDDEFQHAANLVSPDPPKKITRVSAKGSPPPEISSTFKEEKGNKPNIKKLEEVDLKSDKTSTEKVPSISKGKKAESPILENTTSHANTTDDGTKNNVSNAVNKKRKVLRTRIDERGREVTEVVWEGEESDIKPDIGSANAAQNNSVNSASDRSQSNTSSREPMLRKSPAMGNNAPPAKAGKAGSKKGGNKDPKQGNILSFFKKA